MTHPPPHLAERFLRWCIPDGVVGKSIIGDLRQEYNERATSMRFPSLQIWYWSQVVRLSSWYTWTRLARRDRNIPLRMVFKEGLSMSALLQDLRYAIRRLVKTPGFTTVAVLTLALGIGANTAMFTVINSVFLRALPYADPDRIVMIIQTTEAGGGQERPASYPAFEYWRDNSQVFETFAAAHRTSATLRWGEDPERISGAEVSASLFGLLGVNPIVGRGFLSQEDEVGAEPVVVLSHGLWQRLFSGHPEAIGETIRLGSRVRTIVGVMAADFRFPGDDLQFWFPMSDANRAPNTHGLDMIGRLRDGVSVGQARSEVVAIGERLITDNRRAKNGNGTSLALMRDRVVGDSGPILAILGVAVALVLVIACANLANLR